MMAIVHDLAEAIVGDIAPSDGIPKETKTRLEAVAFIYIYIQLVHFCPVSYSAYNRTLCTL